MFKDNYGFLLDDFQKKLELIKNREELKLIEGDFRNFIRDLFCNLGKSIDFKRIENRFDDTQKLDIISLLNTVNLFNKKEFFDKIFYFSENKRNQNSTS